MTLPINSKILHPQELDPIRSSKNEDLETYIDNNSIKILPNHLAIGGTKNKKFHRLLYERERVDNEGHLIGKYKNLIFPVLNDDQSRQVYEFIFQNFTVFFPNKQEKGIDLKTMFRRFIQYAPRKVSCGFAIKDFEQIGSLANYILFHILLSYRRQIFQLLEIEDLYEEFGNLLEPSFLPRDGDIRITIQSKGPLTNQELRELATCFAECVGKKTIEEAGFSLKFFRKGHVDLAVLYIKNMRLKTGENFHFEIILTQTLPDDGKCAFQSDGIYFSLFPLLSTTKIPLIPGSRNEKAPLQSCIDLCLKHMTSIGPDAIGDNGIPRVLFYETKGVSIAQRNLENVLKNLFVSTNRDTKANPSGDLYFPLNLYLNDYPTEHPLLRFIFAYRSFELLKENLITSIDILKLFEPLVPQDLPVAFSFHLELLNSVISDDILGIKSNYLFSYFELILFVLVLQKRNLPEEIWSISFVSDVFENPFYYVEYKQDNKSYILKIPFRPLQALDFLNENDSILNENENQILISLLTYWLPFEEIFYPINRSIWNHIKLYGFCFDDFCSSFQITKNKKNKSLNILSFWLNQVLFPAPSYEVQKKLILSFLPNYLKTDSREFWIKFVERFIHPSLFSKIQRETKIKTSSWLFLLFKYYGSETAIEACKNVLSTCEQSEKINLFLKILTSSKHQSSNTKNAYFLSYLSDQLGQNWSFMLGRNELIIFFIDQLIEINHLKKAKLFLNTSFFLTSDQTRNSWLNLFSKQLKTDRPASIIFFDIHFQNIQLTKNDEQFAIELSHALEKEREIEELLKLQNIGLLHVKNREDFEVELLRFFLKTKYFNEGIEKFLEIIKQGNVSSGILINLFNEYYQFFLENDLNFCFLFIKKLHDVNGFSPSFLLKHWINWSDKIKKFDIDHIELFFDLSLLTENCDQKWVEICVSLLGEKTIYLKNSILFSLKEKLEKVLALKIPLLLEHPLNQALILYIYVYNLNIPIDLQSAKLWLNGIKEARNCSIILEGNRRKLLAWPELAQEYVILITQTILDPNRTASESNILLNLAVEQALLLLGSHDKKDTSKISSENQKFLYEALIKVFNRYATAFAYPEAIGSFCNIFHLLPNHKKELQHLVFEFFADFFSKEKNLVTLIPLMVRVAPVFQSSPDSLPLGFINLLSQISDEIDKYSSSQNDLLIAAIANSFMITYVDFLTQLSSLKWERFLLLIQQNLPKLLYRSLLVVDLKHKLIEQDSNLRVSLWFDAVKNFPENEDPLFILYQESIWDLLERHDESVTGKTLLVWRSLKRIKLLNPKEKEKALDFIYKKLPPLLSHLEQLQKNIVLPSAEEEITAILKKHLMDGTAFITPIDAFNINHLMSYPLAILSDEKEIILATRIAKLHFKWIRLSLGIKNLNKLAFQEMQQFLQKKQLFVIWQYFYQWINILPTFNYSTFPEVRILLKSYLKLFEIKNLNWRDTFNYLIKNKNEKDSIITAFELWQTALNNKDIGNDSKDFAITIYLLKNFLNIVSSSTKKNHHLDFEEIFLTLCETLQNLTESSSEENVSSDASSPAKMKKKNSESKTNLLFQICEAKLDILSFLFEINEYEDLKNSELNKMILAVYELRNYKNYSIILNKLFEIFLKVSHFDPLLENFSNFIKLFNQTFNTEFNFFFECRYLLVKKFLYTKDIHNQNYFYLFLFVNRILNELYMVFDKYNNSQIQKIYELLSLSKWKTGFFFNSSLKSDTKFLIKLFNNISKTKFSSKSEKRTKIEKRIQKKIKEIGTLLFGTTSEIRLKGVELLIKSKDFFINEDPIYFEWVLTQIYETCHKDFMMDNLFEKSILLINKGLFTDFAQIHKSNFDLSGLIAKQRYVLITKVFAFCCPDSPEMVTTYPHVQKNVEIILNIIDLDLEYNFYRDFPENFLTICTKIFPHVLNFLRLHSNHFPLEKYSIPSIMNRFIEINKNYYKNPEMLRVLLDGYEFFSQLWNAAWPNAQNSMQVTWEYKWEKESG